MCDISEIVGKPPQIRCYLSCVCNRSNWCVLCRQQMLFHVLAAYSMYICHMYVTVVTGVLCRQQMLFHVLAVYSMYICHMYVTIVTGVLCRQQMLFHVLAAYSMYNTEVGYCQGMSEIAALLLMYLSEEVSHFSY